MMNEIDLELLKNNQISLLTFTYILDIDIYFSYFDLLNFNRTSVMTVYICTSCKYDMTVEKTLYKDSLIIIITSTSFLLSNLFILQNDLQPFCPLCSPCVDKYMTGPLVLWLCEEYLGT